MKKLNLFLFPSSFLSESTEEEKKKEKKAGQMEILLPESKRRKIASNLVSVTSVVEYDVGHEGDKGKGHEDSSSNGRKSSTVLHVVTPGEVIARNDAGFMRHCILFI
jgi:hypothetical protein